nr:SRPBCC family protein [Kineococcus indalonis]
MTTDPLAAAGLVTRAVRSASRDGVPTKVALAHRTYPTDRADLWDALTDAERVARWFLPVTGDLRPGGRYQLQGNAGGVVERCEAPELLALTWEMGPLVSWLQVRLAADGGGTRLELTHEAPVDPASWEEFGPGAVGVGWDLALVGLGLHLAGGAALDPELAAAFPTTPEGVAFVERAAADWARAAVADGDEPGAAHAAAGRTTAFYTTVPEDAPAEAAGA